MRPPTRNIETETRSFHKFKLIKFKPIKFKPIKMSNAVRH
jgi:hypothetical protein